LVFPFLQLELYPLLQLELYPLLQLELYPLLQLLLFPQLELLLLHLERQVHLLAKLFHLSEHLQLHLFGQRYAYIVL
jgi:hypothetical protein